MSDTVKTVNIKGTKEQGGYVVINESDFDEKAHKLYTGEVNDQPEDLESLTVADLQALAKKRGVELKAGIPKAEIIKALEAK